MHPVLFLPKSYYLQIQLYSRFFPKYHLNRPKLRPGLNLYQNFYLLLFLYCCFPHPNLISFLILNRQKLQRVLQILFQFRLLSGRPVSHYPDQIRDTTHNSGGRLNLRKSHRKPRHYLDLSNALLHLMLLI